MAIKFYNAYLPFIFVLFVLGPCLCYSHDEKLTTLAQAHKLGPTTHHISPLGFLKHLEGLRKGKTAKGISELKKYLTKLGYMETISLLNKPIMNIDLFDEHLESALQRYQSFFHLETTGILDAQTIAQLHLPRCGLPDFTERKKLGRGLEKMGSYYTFFPGGPRWPPNKRILTYSFPQGTRQDVVRPIKYATDAWARVSDFRFRYISDYNKADIKISFQVRDHGDGNPFDGPNGILAHAFSPTDGRLHFDGSESWADGAYPNSFDLQSIGIHELGHILGLGHSSDKAAIMYPYFSAGVRKDLGIDDKQGIHALYGTRENNSSSHIV